jgi:[ribosomal protein S5]-alanine N-acetyltransferase
MKRSSMTLARGDDHIESERLVLRRIVPEDFAFYARMHAIPAVARYLGHGRPRSREESLAWLQATLRSYEDHALGQLAVMRKADGLLIGRCGLSDLIVESCSVSDGVPRAWFQRAEAPADAQVVFERELGYTLDPEYWRHGYATEAARCVFNYACAVLNESRIVSLIHAGNERSLRVAARLGLRRERCVEVMERAFDQYVWPIGASG